MIYEEKITQKIMYTHEDIIKWVKIFAAKQLGVSDDEITDEIIVLSSNDIHITVTHEKIKTNKKEE